MYAKPRADFRTHASSTEAALRKRMPGLFASSGATRSDPLTSNGAARAPRGPPKRVNTLLAGVANEAKVAAERAASMLTAMEKVPWPSDVENGTEPSEELPPVFGPDLPTGDDAVQKLLGDDLAAVMKAKLSRTRDAMDDAMRALRAAEPIDPNASRPSPKSRAAIIASQVDAELASRPRPPPDESAKQRKAKVLEALVREEAEARAKLRNLADDDARVQAEMALFKSEFVMYDKGPYVTQLADGDDDDDCEQPREEQAQEEAQPFYGSPQPRGATQHAEREAAAAADDSVEEAGASPGARSPGPYAEPVLDDVEGKGVAVEPRASRPQQEPRSATDFEHEHEPAWEGADDLRCTDDVDVAGSLAAPQAARGGDDAAAQPSDCEPSPTITRHEMDRGDRSFSWPLEDPEEDDDDDQGEQYSDEEDEYEAVDIMSR